VKIVGIIAIAFFLLIPSTVFADHATTYNEHWDSLCWYDYDRKMRSVAEEFKDGKFMKFHNDILQNCLDEFTPLENEVIPDDDIIHPTCDLSCLPKNYQFGSNRIQDKDVLVCFDKYWSTKSQMARQCLDLPQGEEMQSKHKELEQIWSEKYEIFLPEFYPMEPFFRQFTDDDAFCLLESEDYKDCLLDSHGALENMKAGMGWAYTLLYHGCHSTARNLISSGEMTRAEASYVFNVCEVFSDYILEVKRIIPVEQSVDESEIVCGQGTVLKDGFCVPERKTMTTEMQQKSSNGGGCLIATATFGSELSPQIQQLREIRDNTLLQTESGSAFMSTFNQFYYLFSPTIADLERENPIFKEVVKLTITPLLTSLSILNYVDINSEETVLGYGISLIILNVGMYFVAPIALFTKLKKMVLT